jgi:hypothetical protein
MANPNNIWFVGPHEYRIGVLLLKSFAKNSETCTGSIPAQLLAKAGKKPSLC